MKVEQGQIVGGTVTGIQPYGAFIKMDKFDIKVNYQIDDITIDNLEEIIMYVILLIFILIISLNIDLIFNNYEIILIFFIYNSLI